MFMLTVIDNCYGFGNNQDGQLGIAAFGGNYETPQMLFIQRCHPNHPQNKIKYITCGANHTICITRNNDCYVWG